MQNTTATGSGPGWVALWVFVIGVVCCAVVGLVYLGTSSHSGNTQPPGPSATIALYGGDANGSYSYMPGAIHDELVACLYVSGTVPHATVRITTTSGISATPATLHVPRLANSDWATCLLDLRVRRNGAASVQANLELRHHLLAQDVWTGPVSKR